MSWFANKIWKTTNFCGAFSTWAPFECRKSVVATYLTTSNMSLSDAQICASESLGKGENLTKCTSFVSVCVF